MFIRIQDVPQYERHLLFCSNLSDHRPRRRRRRRSHTRRAVNRSLRVHGEAVGRLIDRSVLHPADRSLPGAA